MKPETYTNALHIGRKIERVRRLRGMTQTDLGDFTGYYQASCLQDGADREA